MKNCLPGWARRRAFFLRCVSSLFFAAALASTLGQSCRPPQLRLGPGERPSGLEGYADLKISDGRTTSKTKFSFVIQLPDKGRIDVFDPLGRSLFTLISDGRNAYFVAVPKKAYWRGSQRDILEEFLGFDLTLEEMGGLLGGGWGPAPAANGEAFQGWAWTRDARGRIVAGEREGLRLEVKDFFAGGVQPHTFLFMCARNSGSIKVTEVRFNVPPRAASFRLWFLGDFRETTREEMERLIRDEDEVVR
jgi:hypothetical protein